MNEKRSGLSEEDVAEAAAQKDKEKTITVEAGEAVADELPQPREIRMENSELRKLKREN